MDAEQEPDSQPTRKRPRIDLGVTERKRGKSMFGIVLGTLNKAKIEDKERNASEAVRIPHSCPEVYYVIFNKQTFQAKKRQMIDQRLQAKLRKETDAVRRTEEAKKDRNAANRKEEDLQLKDSIVSITLISFILQEPMTFSCSTSYEERIYHFILTSYVHLTTSSPLIRWKTSRHQRTL